MDTRTGEIVGAEALARWALEGETLYPRDFIPTLERNGRLLDLDLYILHQVCEDIWEWSHNGNNCVPVSVNFSRGDFCGKERSARSTASMILNVIRESGIDMELITIELTETTDADEQKQLYDFIMALQDEGVRVSVDDFGTGYSSLSILRDFPVSEIKIDRGFISHKALGDHDEVVLRSVIGMANELGLDIVTEGVETVEQAAFMEKMGCSIVQGFLYDHALPKKEWEEKLHVGAYDLVLNDAL